MFIGFMNTFLIDHIVPAVCKSLDTSDIVNFGKEIREACLELYNQARPWDRLESRSKQSQA